MALANISLMSLMVFMFIADISGEIIETEFVCKEHSDCPHSKPACVGTTCMNLCELENMCGTNAICKLQARITPVCYCEGGMIGDPFVECKKPNIVIRDCQCQSDCPGDDYQCIDNKCINPCVSCGENAVCKINPRDGVARCTCPSDMPGNPLISCKSPDVPAQQV
ncbi:uncharacterized protein LOC117170268 [Belonocnema kinseyi]|uniref:uncharacterized protein LOC117170268 n=1 Tax=Belonocnema kinseyi TaxID=2817044 RepID=UPI00143CD446|nr:uncharacterized protein LOC117170268 [Belonocnema kinseyi]